ncbi:9-O-acetylesterase [Bacteroidia bacterium]|nr:9-O-acetylesterase [Bacteroidia bacterium]
MSAMKRSLLTVILIVISFVCGAKVRLPAIISDNMVLQRQTRANIWGWADPGKPITVTTSWNLRQYRATADKDGGWLVKVATPEAGGPYAITVSDGHGTTLKNILIGDVWICAGQSNMEMPVIGFWGQPVNSAAETIMRSGDDRKVRFATIERQTGNIPEKDCTTAWCVASPATTPSFSAIGYFFARELSRTLDIPIGVISSSWGSARMEAFMTREAAAPVTGPEFLDKIDRNDAIQTRPAYLYNGMIAPITRFTARGFVWDQGAANRFEWRQFAALTKAMVEFWRKEWGDDKMPFYNIQLSPYHFGKPGNIEMPLTEMAQLEAVKITPLSYLVPAGDIYNETEPHQPEKDILGRRTALIALVKTYGVETSLPVDPIVPDSIRFDGGKAIVRFANAWYGLYPSSGIEGFELAGEDRVFHPAKARTVPKTPVVEATCDMVPKPVAVRYAFRNQIRATLFNTTGMPVCPFRSDNWDK